MKIDEWGQLVNFVLIEARKVYKQTWNLNHPLADFWREIHWELTHGSMFPREQK